MRASNPSFRSSKASRHLKSTGESLAKDSENFTQPDGSILQLEGQADAFQYVKLDQFSRSDATASNTIWLQQEGIEWLLKTLSQFLTQNLETIDVTNLSSAKEPETEETWLKPLTSEA